MAIDPQAPRRLAHVGQLDLTRAIYLGFVPGPLEEADGIPWRSPRAASHFPRRLEADRGPQPRGRARRQLGEALLRVRLETLAELKPGAKGRGELFEHGGGPHQGEGRKPYPHDAG